jgi:tRNA(Ile)-lysidine synthase
LSTDLSTDLLGLIALLPGPACVAVACSGGRDSMALLHAAASLARQVAGLSVVALHVHHGLSTQADEWVAHVQAQCQAWATLGWPVRAEIRQVTCLIAGRSVEAAAREARYAALAEMARELGADRVLLAHHRRDQAETFLLQALRGAAVAGLASMPTDVWRHGVRWVRPWLGQSREAIEAYGRAHQITYVDDDSNADLRFARNRVRHDVWASLTTAFPQAEQALADAARRLTDAQVVLDEALAERVRALCAGGAADGHGGDAAAGAQASLNAAAWARLDAPHRRLTLMHWYRQCAGEALPASWVDRLAMELPRVLRKDEPASWPPVGLGLYRGRLRWLADMAGRVAQIRSVEQGVSEPMHDWFGAVLQQAGKAIVPDTTVSFPEADDAHILPEWGGVLRVQAVAECGVPRAVLQGLSLCLRGGGETFQLGPGRPARALRKQYQQQGVPAWCRDGPLAWSGDRLVFVPGLGMDARVWAPEGEPQWALAWHPNASNGLNQA